MWRACGWAEKGRWCCHGLYGNNKTDVEAEEKEKKVKAQNKGEKQVGAQ